MPCGRDQAFEATCRPADGAALAVYVICFAVGALSNGPDFLEAGWHPYRQSVLQLDVFWASLVGLEGVVVGLLLVEQSRR